MMTPSETRPGEKDQTILDSITDGVYAVDLDWRGTCSNHAAEEITGIPKKRSHRAIHNNNSNSKGLFVAVNCGALPDTLVESELFGLQGRRLHRCKNRQTRPLCPGPERHPVAR